MIIYPTADLSWMLLLCGAAAVGIIIGIVIGFFLGRKYGHKEEPKAWQLQRHFKAEAERMASKMLLYKSVLKTVQMAVAVPELSEEEDYDCS